MRCRSYPKPPPNLSTPRRESRELAHESHGFRNERSGESSPSALASTIPRPTRGPTPPRYEGPRTRRPVDFGLSGKTWTTSGVSDRCAGDSGGALYTSRVPCGPFSLSSSQEAVA